MAAQLVTAGEPVAFLSLLDARLHVPGASSLFAADEDLLGAFLRDYEIDHTGEPSPDRPARALAEGKHRGILPPWLSLDDLVEMAARYGAAFQHNIGLARAYTPSARVPRLLVVEAADRRELPAAAANWAPWADVVERTEVPGDHFSVLRPPQVDAVASIVAAHLGSPGSGSREPPGSPAPSGTLGEGAPAADRGSARRGRQSGHEPGDIKAVLDEARLGDASTRMGEGVL